MLGGNIERVSQAFEHGTIDAREDRHFTWTDLTLDEIAWSEIIERLDGLFERLFEAQAESNARLAKGEGEPISVTVALAGFESPPCPTLRAECLSRLPE